jgi:hypothetical protein
MEVWELVARESIPDRVARWNSNSDAAPSDPARVPVGRYLPPGGRPSIRHHTRTVQIDLLSETSARVRADSVVLSSVGVDQVDPEGWAGSFDESVARTP